MDDATDYLRPESSRGPAGVILGRPSGGGEWGPRYLAVKNALLRSVLEGRYADGEQFPTEKALCEDFELSRSTVQRALRDLVEEGYLVRQQGRGTYVRIERDAAQKRMIGCLFPLIKGFPSAIDRVIEGADAVAREHGYKLIVASSENKPDHLLDEAARLNQSKVAGTLMLPVLTGEIDVANKKAIHALKRAGQQVIMLDSSPTPDDDLGVSRVFSKNREGIYDMTRHLIGLGYERISFLTGPRSGAVVERENGFRDAMSEAGLDVPPEYLLRVALTRPEQLGVQEADVLMALKHPPRAIVCYADLVALNVLRRCAQRGWKVPEQVAVTGFDDLYQSRICDPPLTTVHQPVLELGARGVQLLIGLLEGSRTPPVIETIDCSLKIRASCGSEMAQGQS